MGGQINLVELGKYHHYGIPAFAEHAGVTRELMEEALKGNEELYEDELRAISRLTHIPFGVLNCNRLIKLDKRNYRHREMVETLYKRLWEIWEWQKKGSHKADLFMNYRGRINLVNMWLDFYNYEVSYVRYLAVKSEVEDTFLYINNEMQKQRRRGLKKQAERNTIEIHMLKNQTVIAG